MKQIQHFAFALGEVTDQEVQEVGDFFMSEKFLPQYENKELSESLEIWRD